MAFSLRRRRTVSDIHLTLFAVLIVFGLSWYSLTYYPTTVSLWLSRLDRPMRRRPAWPKLGTWAMPTHRLPARKASSSALPARALLQNVPRFHVRRRDVSLCLAIE